MVMVLPRAQSGTSFEHEVLARAQNGTRDVHMVLPRAQSGTSFGHEVLARAQSGTRDVHVVLPSCRAQSIARSGPSATITWLVCVV